MRKRPAEKEFPFRDERMLLSGTFEFHPDLPVSQQSRFADSKWNWNDETNRRLKCLNPGKLMFDWGAVTLDSAVPFQPKVKTTGYRVFSPQLPQEMVEDLRRAFFIILFYSSLIRGEHRHEMKPANSVRYIKQAVNFFSHLYALRQLQFPLTPIKELKDVTLTDIKKGIETYPYETRDLKALLNWLAVEVVQSNLKHGRIHWSSQDIKNLHWPLLKEYENIPTLPDRLFWLLSSSAADLLFEFHHLLGNTTRDAISKSAANRLKEHKWVTFREMFDSYILRRFITRSKGRQWSGDHTKFFTRKFGQQPKAIGEFLRDVQTAAFQIILLYTGMRYSEAATLQRGCLLVRDGVTLIKSTLIKGKPSNLPLDQDEWVAIPIVQDAVHALEEMTRFTFNSFLFANFTTVREGGDESPISNVGLTERLHVYLKKFDKEGEWSDWLVTPHQYRHGLIYQLAKAEVGIPYITRQLKHVYTLLDERSYKINQTSTIYGMQRHMLIANAIGSQAMKHANQSLAKDLYGQGKRFAGGGATMHVEKTEAFFRGIGLEGKARENYIERLADAGLNAIRTGVGWCVRNHVDPRKLKESPPPCIGDLNCNPHTCVYSVVPESRKVEVTARYRNAAKQLVSPDQSHLTSHWQKELNAYSAMLEQLGIDPKNLTGPGVSPDTIRSVLAGN